MLVGFYSAATGMQAAERMHDVIAENLAHASVPGYRAQVLSQQTFEQAMQGAIEAPSAVGHGTMASELGTNFSPGPTAETGRSLDVAIGGDGFFEVAGPEGPLYTRNGVFYLNEDGQLITSEGMLVQGENGPISIPANVSAEQIHIAQDGSVSAKQAQFGKLRVATFGDNTQLIRRGTTLFSAPAGTSTPSTSPMILQGARELSNVSAVSEMVRMIWGTRHYEAAQKALSTMDQAIGQVTNPQA